MEVDTSQLDCSDLRVADYLDMMNCQQLVHSATRGEETSSSSSGGDGDSHRVRKRQSTVVRKSSSWSVVSGSSSSRHRGQQLLDSLDSTSSEEEDSGSPGGCGGGGQDQDELEQLGDFGAWLESLEERLEDTCYCSSTAATTTSRPQEAEDEEGAAAEEAVGWQHWLVQHQQVQAEVERGSKLFPRLLQQSKSESPAVNCTSSSSPSSSSSVREQLVDRWHRLWLRSLELLLLLETLTSQCPCPKHPAVAAASKTTASKMGTAAAAATTTTTATTTTDSSQGYSSDADLSDNCTPPTVLPAPSLSSLVLPHHQVTRRARGSSSTGANVLLHRPRPWSFHSQMDLSALQQHYSHHHSHHSHQQHHQGGSATPSGRKVRRRRHQQQPQQLQHWPSASEVSAAPVLDWDYYQPPPASSSSNTTTTRNNHSSRSTAGSEERTARELVQSLTEFGENYDLWLKREEDHAFIRSSTPVRDLIEPLPPPPPPRSPQSPSLASSCCTKSTATSAAPVRSTGQQTTAKSSSSSAGLLLVHLLLATLLLLVVLCCNGQLWLGVGGGPMGADSWLERVYPRRPPPV
ncbi:hypothetical protein HDE_11544 [Halotydeus destructor]|nr:hypothetical protein HDE_11544 [Halotydeus destructor]